MVRARAPPIQRIIGLILVIAGFAILVVIFNPNGLVGPPISDRIAWLLIAYTIGAMISLGGAAAAGYEPKKVLEVLAVSGLCVLLIAPILYLPLSEDMLAIALGFSPFLGLLLWTVYAKLKARIQGNSQKRKTTT